MTQFLRNGLVPIVDDLTATAAELNFNDTAVAGTAVASKTLVLGADKNIDTLAIADSGLKLGAGAGTAVTATAAELNLLDTSVAGTAVASKALVLGANKNVDVLAVADLKLGADAGTSVTATAAQLNKTAVTTAGTVEASKALIVGADKNIDTLAIADGGLKLGAGAGTAVTATAVQLNEAGSKASSASRLYNLGAPALADDDLIVTTTNMIVGEYTVAAQPDVPRNITVTASAGDTADTMGTITIVGTNYDDEVITEEIIPATGSTVAGALAFKTVTTVTGAGWVLDEFETTNDTIVVGIGNELGLPIVLDVTTEVMLSILGTTITATNATVATPATLEGTTIDMSSSTYNGTKEALVFIVD